MSVIRAGALRAAVIPALAGIYLLGTWGERNRPVMVAIVGVLLTLAGLGWWAAAGLAQSRWRLPLQVTGTVITVGGCAALGILDGGVASPLGDMVPLSLLFLASVVPPRVFAGVAALALAAYWTVAVVGEPAPAGYPLVYTLGCGGVAYLCLRYSGALVSLRRRLTEISRTDPLTGCLNRRGFAERLHEELAEAARSDEPVTLVLLDLDRFKEVNDSYGHRAGDDLLAWIGRTLREELRAHDAIGRLGGDEFAAVLADTPGDGAAVVVDRLRSSLGPAAPASFGFAVYPAEAATVEELTQLADERLYADKVARDRQPPSPDGVAAAKSGVDVATPAVVSRQERRRHAIADAGWISLAQTTIGFIYVLFFAAGHPFRAAITGLCLWGTALGLAVIVKADWLSRTRARKSLMMAFTASQFISSMLIAAFDGGASSALALGMLLSLPLITLGLPVRAAIPIVAGASALYIGVAVMVHVSSGWYVVTHLLGMLAVSTACAIQGRTAARQRALLTRMSKVDPLTGVLNRRGFTERFTAEVAHARRTGRPATLLLLDLDGFKELNDQHGHAAGDDLLHWVAAALTEHLHPHDVVGRLGGDEFVALVGSCHGEQAIATAERLRAALAERTQVSIGTAVLHRDGEDFDTLYASADARLYEQKAHHRRYPTDPLPVPPPAGPAVAA